MLLFNESLDIERSFSRQTPLEVLDFLFPDSSSYATNITKGAFFESLAHHLSPSKFPNYTLHTYLIQETLDAPDASSTDLVCEWLEEFLVPDTSDSYFKEFILGQLSLFFYTLNSTQDDSLLKEGRARELFLSVFYKYIESNERIQQILDIPFLYSQYISIEKSEDVTRSLIEFMVNIEDKNSLKLVKYEIQKYFSTSISNSIFLDAAKCSKSLIENTFVDAKALERLDHQLHDIDSNIYENFLGLEWVIDSEKNMSDVFKMANDMLRKILLKKQFKHAIKFNHEYLNKLITEFSDKIRMLTDSQDDLEVKSLIKEKFVFSKILDSFAGCENFNASKVGYKIMNLGSMEHKQTRREHLRSIRRQQRQPSLSSA